MNKIRVIIVDDHRIVSEGIEALIDTSEDISVVAKVADIDQLFPEIRKHQARIVLVNVYEASDSDIEMIKSINKKHAEVKILIISMSADESFILKTLKTGAKGYLSKDTYRNQLFEAIYTLRNGYEYYSKSISNIILRNYLTDEIEKNDSTNKTLQSLTNREQEVLKLFADGYGNQKIANTLFISIRTVETHKTNIMQKLDIKTTVELVKFAIRNDIIKI